jgi:hypothetical protein
MDHKSGGNDSLEMNSITDREWQRTAWRRTCSIVVELKKRARDVRGECDAIGHVKRNVWL